jgi:hypothetical protein
MRHVLALLAVLVLAGACLATEFKSDEAKKAQADYLAAPEAAKMTYGQGLAKAKATIDAKAAAATDAISKEAIQAESAAITEELVRLRDANAASFEPREWKSEETRKVNAAYAAELKAAQMKYGQDLARARQTIIARKAAATDSAAKDALQTEIGLIEEVQARLVDLKYKATTRIPAKGGIPKIPDKEPAILLQQLRKFTGKKILLVNLKPLSRKVGFVGAFESQLGDEKYETLYAHAASKIVFEIPKGAQYLTGVADPSLTGTVAFFINADDKEIWKSGEIRKTGEMHVFSLKLPEKAKFLALIVGDLGNNDSDHSCWIYPFFSADSPFGE